MMYGKARTRRRLHGHSIGTEGPTDRGTLPVADHLTWVAFARCSSSLPPCAGGAGLRDAAL